MDALSAMKMVSPDLNTKLNGGATDALAGKMIPTPDLEKLANTSASTSSAAAATPMALAGGSGSSFSNLLGNFVSEVNSKQAAASDAVTGLMSGKNVSLHQAMISMEEASVSFQMMVEVRNKLLDSYQELMRMQV